MKGISFQNGVEFKIVIEGESWSQGDVISGTLEAVVKNPTAVLLPLRVVLAEGSDKKVKLKTAGAFKEIAAYTEPTHSLSWSFQLDKNAKITEKSNSYYLLYGTSESLESLAQLRLNILPHLYIRELIETLVSHFRFAFKSFSPTKSGSVEAKLAPPAAKEWAFLEQLLIQLKLTPTTLEMICNFHRNEVDATKSGLATKKVNREISRTIELPLIVHEFNQRLNIEAVIAIFEAIIIEYREAGWLS